MLVVAGVITRNLVASAVFLTFLGAPSPGTAMELTCSGVVVVENEELALKPDPGSALWCDASFEGDKYGVAKPGISERVGATCGEGNRCRVTGIVQGHGVFYWVTIKSVDKLPNVIAAQAADDGSRPYIKQMKVITSIYEPRGDAYCASTLEHKCEPTEADDRKWVQFYIINPTHRIIPKIVVACSVFDGNGVVLETRTTDGLSSGSFNGPDRPLDPELIKRWLTDVRSHDTVEADYEQCVRSMRDTESARQVCRGMKEYDAHADLTFSRAYSNAGVRCVITTPSM